MPEGRFKSRSMKRRVRITPSGERKKYYIRANPKQASCGNCSAKLHGIPRVKSLMLQRLGKTLKRPERPFGGTFCTKCSRKEIKVTKRELA